jgi:thiol-disulfide isomerase/thioredoxin
MDLLNQYSYLFISLGILAGIVLVLRYFGVSRQIISTAVLGLAGLILVGFFLLRPGFSDVNDIAEARNILQNGRPTMLEFFSNYCAGCMAVRPVVDNLVADIEDEFNIIRIDIHSEAGRELRQQLAFSYTPEFVLFDQNGEEVWRAHVPPGESELELAQRDQAAVSLEAP